MISPEDVVLAIFGATAALAALVLVFLGLVASSIGGLSGSASSTVELPYKITAGVAFAAFVLSIVCSGLGTWWLLLGQTHHVYLAIVWAFLAELALLTVAATRVFINLISS